MIRSFGSKDTQRLFNELRVPRFQSIERIAFRRLQYLNEAESLNDLRVPGLRLEALLGDRFGFCSIRINDRWRVCFRWMGGDTYNVDIVDYH